MNTEQVQFRIRDHAPDTLFLEEEVQRAEAALLRTLEGALPGSTVRVDFQEVRIASAAVRGLLRRPLRRLHGGEQAELRDRFIALDNVRTNWHSLDVTLRAEDAIAIAHREAHDVAQLVGKQDVAVRATYDFVRSRDAVTANMIMQQFDLTIAAAGNRLATLARYGLVRRFDQRPTPTGGREYLYKGIR